MQEGVYSCMYTLVNSKSILSTWQLTVVRVILEGLVRARSMQMYGRGGQAGRHSYRVQRAMRSHNALIVSMLALLIQGRGHLAWVGP